MIKPHPLLVSYLKFPIDAWNKVQTSLGDTILKDLTLNKIKTKIMKRMVVSY